MRFQIQVREVSQPVYFLGVTQLERVDFQFQRLELDRAADHVGRHRRSRLNIRNAQLHVGYRTRRERDRVT